jgi:hypothetical protein
MGVRRRHRRYAGARPPTMSARSGRACCGGPQVHLAGLGSNSVGMLPGLHFRPASAKRRQTRPVASAMLVQTDPLTLLSPAILGTHAAQFRSPGSRPQYSSLRTARCRTRTRRRRSDRRLLGRAFCQSPAKARGLVRGGLGTPATHEPDQASRAPPVETIPYARQIADSPTALACIKRHSGVRCWWSASSPLTAAGGSVGPYALVFADPRPAPFLSARGQVGLFTP